MPRPQPPAAPLPAGPLPPDPRRASPTGADPRTRIAPPPDRTVLARHSNPAALPDADAAPRLIPGTVINNNYRIVEEISSGGMGRVYRAVNSFTGDPVAVKIILPELARDTAIIEMFRREARLLVKLRDDAIVRYHNFVQDEATDLYCLIMEFVEGVNLGDRIEDARPLPEDEAVRLLRRLARGLGQAHARGVTHRDLSPDNVILPHDNVDEAVLIDFGIARSTEMGDGLAGRFAGKFKYVAPEQLGQGSGIIGPRTDIYGLALLLAAAVRGKPLPMGHSETSAADARRQIPALSGISQRLYPLLQHMLEPDPVDRPVDMEAVRAILDDPTRLPARYRLPLWDVDSEPGDQAAKGLAAPAELLSPAGPVAGRSRAGFRAAAVAGVAILAAGAAGWWWLGDRPAAPQVAAIAPERQAVQLPPRDAETRDGFLAAQPLPPCSLIQRIESGPHAGMIETYAAQPFDPAPVLAAYETRFGTRPDLLRHAVDQRQCAALQMARDLAGRGTAPPQIAVDLAPVAEGIGLRGTVSRLGGRNLWLFLVSPEGSVFDLTGQTAAQGKDRVDLAAMISAPGGELADGYLLVAAVSPQPLAAVAAAPAAAAAETLLPRVMAEITAQGGGAATVLRIGEAVGASPPPAPSADPA